MKNTAKRHTPTKAEVASQKAKRTKYSVSTLKQSILNVAYYLDSRDYLSDDEIHNIERDATFISSLAIRKAATLKKELVITCEDETVKNAFTALLSFSFRTQALDTHLQGMSVFELVWEKKEGLWFPTPKERDYRDFIFMHNEPLRYVYSQEFIPNHKAVIGLYNPKFNKLHGKSLYNALFWLIKFKNASIDFWIEYMQRFSSPWIVGTTEGDKDEMADNLYAMLAGDVAVIEDEDKIDLVTPTIKADFKDLASYADDQIREILLGGNLLGEVKGGSLAASQTHQDVLQSIAMMDEHILQELIDNIVLQFIKVNNFSKELTITLKDKDADNVQRAKRDLDIYKLSGGKYVATKAYIEKTYGIELEEVKKETNTALPFKFSATQKEDFLASQDVTGKDVEALEKSILLQIENAFAKASSYAEAKDVLTKVYEELDTKQVEEMLTHYIANANILGKAEVESEHPHG